MKSNTAHFDRVGYDSPSWPRVLGTPLEQGLIALSPVYRAMFRKYWQVAPTDFTRAVEDVCSEGNESTHTSEKK